MPSLFTINGYKIFFFSDEGNEPIHVHVCYKTANREHSTKFWLTRRGGVILANNKAGLSEKDIAKLSEFLEAQFFYILRRWKEYFLTDDVKFYC